MNEKPTILEWCVYALAALGLHVVAIGLALLVGALA